MILNATKSLPIIPTPIFSGEVKKLANFPLKSRPPNHIFRRLRIVASSASVVPSDVSPSLIHDNPVREKLESLEVNIEKVIYGCRFFAILAVWGSLIGSFLCFFKGCVFVVTAFQEYIVHQGQVIALLIEATDVYLLGTVMLVFGMGLYELFISNLDKAKTMADGGITTYRSNMFGLFALKERPRWLEVKTVNALKTRLGHVIVMLLLIGLFDKSKRAAINTPLDLLCFAASVLLCSGSLLLLSKLKD